MTEPLMTSDAGRTSVLLTSRSSMHASATLTNTDSLHRQTHGNRANQSLLSLVGGVA